MGMKPITNLQEFVGCRVGKEATVKHTVTCIPGDGIGPEITAVMKACVEATGVQIEWEEINVEWGDAQGNVAGIPRNLIDSIQKNRVAIKGPITTPVGKGYRSLNVTLRQMFDLYACLRPCKLYPGARTRYDRVDLVVVRENMEDLYKGIEYRSDDPVGIELREILERRNGVRLTADTAVGIKAISRAGSERIARFAFEYARDRHRKKVTVVHKANIMKFTDGLFAESARTVAADYPDISCEEILVDNLCMQLVARPEEFDVLLLPNLYGDIVSDLCAGLVGGLGLAPGANFGTNIAIFEATHGSAPKYAGADRVNPGSLILSGVLMLEHLGEQPAARALEAALASVVRDGEYVTYDFKQDRSDPSAVGTRGMGEAIIRELRRA